jgi:multidrug resistance efflux pump
VSGWKTIPRWLYETDAPDDQLQALYVKAARKKLAELEAERAALDAQIAQATAFLADAERALRQYQKRLNRG